MRLTRIPVVIGAALAAVASAAISAISSAADRLLMPSGLTGDIRPAAQHPLAVTPRSTLDTRRMGLA